MKRSLGLIALLLVLGVSDAAPPVHHVTVDVYRFQGARSLPRSTWVYVEQALIEHYKSEGGGLASERLEELGLTLYQQEIPAALPDGVNTTVVHAQGVPGVALIAEAVRLDDGGLALSYDLRTATADGGSFPEHLAEGRLVIFPGSWAIGEGRVTRRGRTLIGVRAEDPERMPATPESDEEATP